MSPGARARLARLVDRRAAAALAAQLRAPRTWVWAALLTLLAGAMCLVPLFNVLGYEFAFVMAIAGSVAAADLGAALTRRLALIAADDPGDSHPGQLLPGGRLVASLAGAAVLLALLLLIPPLLVIAANGLRVQNCDWGFGLECYGAMPVLSASWAAGLGVAAALVAGRRRILSNALPHLLLLACVVHAVWRFYAAPPVFSYSPLAGYYSGNLYDEEIQLTVTLLWSRLHQGLALVAALALLAAIIDVPSARVHLRPPRRPGGVRFEIAVCLVALAGALWLRASAGELGFSLSSADVSEALPGRYETEHFVIHYPPGGDIERDIALIADDHEFRLAQLVRTFGVEPSGRITSFYFAHAEQKRVLMGAKNVYMAKPWREEIYLHHAAFPHQVVRHEIAHVVAGYFGDPLFHVSAGRVLGLPLFFNVGLIEGIAVASDWPDHFTRALTPHQSVKAMSEMGMAPPVERLLSTGFFQFSSARSYTAAGSFVRFLLDRHGAGPLRELYRTGGDFQAAYGRPQGELVAAWRAMIDEIELEPGAAEMVRERFRRGGIFQRPCPHAIADRRLRAGQAIGRGDTERALELLRAVCEDAPEEPTYRMDLADLLSRVGRHGEALALYDPIAAGGETISSTLRVRALLGAARLAAHAGDWSRVRELLSLAEELPVDDDLARNLRAQSLAAAHAGPAGPALRAYFWPPQVASWVDPLAQLGRATAALAAEPELGLAHYLVARNLIGRGADAEVVRGLERAIALGLPGPLFEREAAAGLAAAGYMAGDLAAVERAAAILTAAHQPTVTRLYGYDWLERVHWKRHGRVPEQPLGPPATPPPGPVTSR